MATNEHTARTEQIDVNYQFDDYHRPENFNRKIWTLAETEDTGKVGYMSMTLGQLCTATMRTIEIDGKETPRFFVHDKVNLMGWGNHDLFPHTFAIFETPEQAEHALLLALLEDMQRQVPKVRIYDTLEEAEEAVITQFDMAVPDREPIDPTKARPDVLKTAIDNQEHRVNRTGEPDLVFTGETIATLNNKERDSTTWTYLALFKTTGNRFVCRRVECSTYEGVDNEYFGEVADTQAEVIAFFGQSRLAHLLYAHAGIDNSVAID